MVEVEGAMTEKSYPMTSHSRIFYATNQPAWVDGSEPRQHLIFFVQIGHETMYAAIGNHHFFTKTCHRQTYQNY
jgi:hypothetical protein